MYFLQANNQPTISLVLFLGTLGMLVLTIGLILFIIFHQRKVIRYQMRLQHMEGEQQKILLNASIRLQEEERQRLAADLHDDARMTGGKAGGQRNSHKTFPPTQTHFNTLAVGHDGQDGSQSFINEIGEFDDFAGFIEHRADRKFDKFQF